MRLAAPILLALASLLAGCSEVAIDCGSFATWGACPLEEGCGWGAVDREWRCVTPCESDDDCDEGACEEVGSGADSEAAYSTFSACVE